AGCLLQGCGPARGSGLSFLAAESVPPAEDAAETERLDLGPACAWRLAWGSCQVNRETEPGDEDLGGERLCEQLVDGTQGPRIGSRCSSLVGSESLKTWGWKPAPHSCARAGRAEPTLEQLVAAKRKRGMKEQDQPQPASRVDLSAVSGPNPDVTARAWVEKGGSGLGVGCPGAVRGPGLRELQSRGSGSLRSQGGPGPLPRSSQTVGAGSGRREAADRVEGLYSHALPRPGLPQPASLATALSNHRPRAPPYQCEEVQALPWRVGSAAQTHPHQGLCPLLPLQETHPLCLPGSLPPPLSECCPLHPPLRAPVPSHFLTAASALTLFDSVFTGPAAPPACPTAVPIPPSRNRRAVDGVFRSSSTPGASAAFQTVPQSSCHNATHSKQFPEATLSGSATLSSQTVSKGLSVSKATAAIVPQNKQSVVFLSRCLGHSLTTGSVLLPVGASVPGGRLQGHGRVTEQGCPGQRSVTTVDEHLLGQVLGRERPEEQVGKGPRTGRGRGVDKVQRQTASVLRTALSPGTAPHHHPESPGQQGRAQIIDLMVLVIDVTKGMQTQSAECLVIGQIACQKLVVVLNKTDLLPEGKRQAAIEKMTKKMQKTLEHTRFRGAPIIPVAARPGGPDAPETEAPQGIPELIELLTSQISIPRRDPSGPFLMSVDHCFSIKGQGTVMTGTILSGSVSLGDSVEIPTLK
ncbi:hypothetical protein EI555_019732, partial [Monodon monoceros]